MTEPMSLARFQDLADAYGGVVARWPDECRAAAMTVASQPEAGAILTQASVLDAALDAWDIALPTHACRDRIAARAPGPAPSVVVRARLWWSGLGLAAALAGAAAGTAAAASVTPADVTPDNSTSFGDVGPQES